jgi:copper chaperone NosL
MKKNSLSLVSKIALAIMALLFIGSIFVPLWQIELEAPQYPEGLVLKMHANKIAGDVEIINGLNHYIGMATLHTENFVEFSIVPYIIGLFAIISILLIFLNNRKGLLAFGAVLVSFVVIAGIDFYRWNYQYGHNLDPNAAIKVPGMAYQPPVLGYKKLLNFGAYSIPDIGGWMLITAGILLTILVIKEYRFQKK